MISCRNIPLSIETFKYVAKISICKQSSEWAIKTILIKLTSSLVPLAQNLCSLSMRSAFFCTSLLKQVMMNNTVQQKEGQNDQNEHFQTTFNPQKASYTRGS